MTYNIEQVPARLLPFDWAQGGTSASTADSIQASLINNGTQASPTGQTMTDDEQAIVNAITSAAGLAIGHFSQATTSTDPTGLSTRGGAIFPSSHPLYPLTLTGGLVFPYNPTISEKIGIRYDVTELTHTNENIHAFKNSDNVRITLSECVWTSETWDQAIYTLGVIHFFRSYRLMDFGRKGSGRPPSPMWFSAYGAYLYQDIPVIMEGVDFTLPVDCDYVGVPNPGTDSYDQQILQYSTSAALGTLGSQISQTDQFTWLPIKFTVGSISLVVQNSVAYWTKKFTLDDFKSGAMIGVR